MELDVPHKSGHVLVCIAEDPESCGRDIAERVRITERAAQAIVAELVGVGYIEGTRLGRRNHYEVVSDQRLRHPIEESHSIGELLRVIVNVPAAARASSAG